MLAAYVAGIFLAWQQSSFYVILLLSVLAYILIILLMLRVRQKLIGKLDKFAFLLPILMLAGFLATHDRLKKPELYNLFDHEISCELTGEIVKIAESKYSYSLYLKDNTITTGDGKKYSCNKVIVKSKYMQSNSEKQSQTYRIGNKIHAAGSLKKFSTARNPGNFNEQLYYQIEDIFFYLDAKQITITDSDYSPYHNLLANIKKRIKKVFDLMLSDREAATLAAMLLGEKSHLDEEQRRLYQENGISHILAISGLHIGLIAMFFFKLLRKLRCPLRPASIITIFFIYSYGVLTDFSVSTNRAIVMMVISLMAPLAGKCYDMLSAVCLSALIILMQNPMQIISAGFLLSYGAVLGIAVVYPELKKVFACGNPDKANKSCNNDSRQTEKINISEANEIKNIDISGEVTVIKDDGFFEDKNAKKGKMAYMAKLLREVKDSLINSLLVSISTQLTTIPVILLFFYQIPVYSVLINLIVLALITVLMLSAIIGAVAGVIYLPAGVYIIGGANYILKFYEIICRFGMNLPGNIFTAGKPDMFKIIAYFICLGIFLIFLRWYRIKTAFMVMAAGLLLLLMPKRDDCLLVAFLDVGQGDAIYMESATNTSYLIDGGSSDVSKTGIYRIRPYLLARGMDRIDYAIVTHSDKDHTGGLIELINDGRIKIKNIILPDIAIKDEAYLNLEKLARHKNIAVSYISSGDIIRDGDLMITCLHPPEGYRTENSNAYSTVLSIQYYDFSMLLTGDLEADGEAMVMEEFFKKQYAGNTTNQFTEYDLLKVAHHGSKNSTSEEFLSYVRPKVAVISCGFGNSYGHPHPELLERLDEIGSNYFITYEKGAITICTDGERMVLNEYLDK